MKNKNFEPSGQIFIKSSCSIAACLQKSAHFVFHILFTVINRILRHGLCHKRSLALIPGFSSFFLILCLGLITPAAQADHDDDARCPDIEISGGESMEGWVHDKDSGALLPSGSIVPAGTYVQIHVRATAFGSCQANNYSSSSGSCELSQFIYQRTVSHADYFYSIDNLDPAYRDFDRLWNPNYGHDPDGTTGFFHVLDTHDLTTSSGPRQEVLWREGIYTFEFGSLNNITNCNILPKSAYDDMVIISVDSDTNDLGCSKDASVGNPCNIATGNKYETKTDLPLTHGGLLFRRTYNSKFNGDLGLGAGWTSTYHRRIQRLNNVITIRRPSGYAEKFTLNGTSWDSEAESHNRLTEDDGDYVLKLADNSEERYNTVGQLLQITRVDGRVQTADYNTAGLLQTITADNGESLSFVHNSNNHLESVTHHPSNRAWRYTYSNTRVRNLTGVENPDTSTLQYHYENADFLFLLTGITDEKNIRYATFEYDANGWAKANYHIGNVNRVDIAYDNATTRTLTNSRGDTTTYTINALNGVSMVTDIAGPGCSTCSTGNTTKSFDSANNNLLTKTENGQITSWGDYDLNGHPGYMIIADGMPQARRTDYIYDPRFSGLITHIIEPSVFSHPSRVLAFDSDAQGTRTLVEAVGYKVTTYGYDDFGNLTSETVAGFDSVGTPVNRTTTRQYNGPLRQLSQIDGPRTDINDTTYYRYYLNDSIEGNNRARLKEIEDTSGKLIRSNIQYTASGKVASESHPNGLELNFVYYSGNDRLQTLSESDGTNSRVTRWTYLTSGEVESITTADGTLDATTLTFGYDDARRLIRITDGEGNYIQYTLDTEGNREQETIFDANGTPLDELDDTVKKSIAHEFDIYSRLNSVKIGVDSVNPLEASVPEYSADGTLDNQTDGEGSTTDYSYDGLRRLLTETQNLGGLNALTQYNYDVANRISDVTDPNNGTTIYQYDDLGNLLQTTSPDTGATVYSYDNAGNMKTKTVASGGAEAVTLTYSYDALNRLNSVVTPTPADNISYTYDSCFNGVGRLCKVETEAANVFYRYDSFGNNISNQGVAYGYDNADRINSLTYPSGVVLNFDYDGAGQINQVNLTVNGIMQPLASSISYAPFGDVTSLDYGNGESLTQSYDTAYRMIMQFIPDVLDLSYPVYDSNGNLKQRDDPNNVPATSNFDYDPLNRLDIASGPFGSNWDYDYDLNGNRTLSDEGIIVNSLYESNSNRLDQLGTSDVVLNVAGSTLSSGNWIYGYTSHQRLANAAESGQEKASFAYNGLGQRVLKTQPDGTGKHFFFGQNGELLVETDNFGNVLVEYFYLNGKLLALYHPDSDQDGHTNQQEKILGTNPVSPDDDDDGLNNLDELLVYGTFIGNEDTDADGVVDGLEVANNTNPSDPGSGYLVGDVNLNGQVDLADYLLLTQYVVGTKEMPDSESVQFLAADMNADGLINAGDLVVLQRTILGLVWNDWVEGALVMWEGFIPTVEAVVSQGELYYVHNDHLGTPQVVTDEGGAVVWKAVYDPFGKATIDVASTVELNVRFPGQYYDSETPLHYNYFRHYSPELGRYITSDPIGLLAGVNTYGYAGENPLRYVDPFGLIWVTVAIDYHGAKNWFMGISNRFATLGEGTIVSPKNCVGCTRDIIQEWVPHPNDPQNKRNFCTADDPSSGDQRKIEQQYGEFPDFWRSSGPPDYGKSWHWEPPVPSPTYKSTFEGTFY